MGVVDVRKASKIAGLAEITTLQYVHCCAVHSQHFHRISMEKSCGLHSLATRILCVGHLLWRDAVWKSGKLGWTSPKMFDLLVPLFFQEELIHATRIVSVICQNQLGAGIATCAGCSTNHSTSGWNTAWLSQVFFIFFVLFSCFYVCQISF